MCKIDHLEQFGVIFKGFLWKILFFLRKPLYVMPRFDDPQTHAESCSNNFEQFLRKFYGNSPKFHVFQIVSYQLNDIF